jgi:hypothetical protein
MKERYPATKPTSKRQQDEEAAAREQQDAAEYAKDRLMAGLAPDVEVEMSPEEITLEEQERQSMAESIRVEKAIRLKADRKRREAQDGLTQRGEPASVTPDAVPRQLAARLAEDEPKPQSRPTTSFVKAKAAEALERLRSVEAENKALAEAAEKAKAEREAEEQRAREQLGAAQDEMRVVTDAEIAEALNARADALQAQAVQNRMAESDDEEISRLAFIEDAKAVEAELLEVGRGLIALQDTHGSALKKMGSISWEGTDPSWQAIYRVRYEGEISKVAAELSSKLTTDIKVVEEYLTQLDVAARRNYRGSIPRAWILERARRWATSRVEGTLQQIRVLNESARRLEQAARMNSTPGKRPVVNIRVRPIVPAQTSSQPKTEWDSRA